MGTDLQQEENNFLIKRQAELGLSPSLKRVLEVWQVVPKISFMMKSNKNYRILFSANFILAFIIFGCIFLFVRASNMFNTLNYIFSFLCAIYLLISFKLYKKRFKKNKNTNFAKKLFKNIREEHLKYLYEKASENIKISYIEYIRSKGMFGKVIVYLAGMSSTILYILKKIYTSSLFSRLADNTNTNNEVVVNIFAFSIVIIPLIVLVIFSHDCWAYIGEKEAMEILKNALCEIYDVKKFNIIDPNYERERMSVLDELKETLTILFPTIMKHWLLSLLFVIILFLLIIFFK